MELEKKQAETNYQQLSHDLMNRQQVSSAYVEPGRATANQPGSDRSNCEGRRGLRLQVLLFPHRLLQNVFFMFTEYSLKLQSVEAQCKALEKQLTYMRKMVENGNKERKAVIEKQVFQKSVNQNWFLKLYLKIGSKS